MHRNLTANLSGMGIVFPAVLSCLLSGAVVAAETPSGAYGSALLFASETLGLASPNDATAVAEATTPPLPMLQDPNAGMAFDLGGSETRKLQLMLDQPLSLHGGMRARAYENGTDLLGLDATLEMPLTHGFSLHTGVDRQKAVSQFHALGSIQCSNGTLRADSYTASGCRFVNEPMLTAEQQRLALGASLDLRNASASVNWFTQDAGVEPGGAPWRVGSLLSPQLANPLLPAGGDPLQYLNSEASGVDLNFKVGIATDDHGDLQLGLAFSRVFDADWAGLYANNAQPLSWTLAEPFNSARMGLEWSRGSFSTGIQAYYRDPVTFLDRNSLDSLATFDVHFTWRTPWNANLSVGASNVLNAGTDSVAGAENQSSDPLESIYGRIPYVRYKQDL
jgi:hypothetical protein